MRGNLESGLCACKKKSYSLVPAFLGKRNGFCNLLKRHLLTARNVGTIKSDQKIERFLCMRINQILTSHESALSPWLRYLFSNNFKIFQGKDFFKGTKQERQKNQRKAITNE